MAMCMEETGTELNESSAGKLYVVNYGEDLWNAYDKDGQEFCFETWTKKAKPLGCTQVVLRLLPDPLFPSGDHAMPYIADRRHIAADPRGAVRYRNVVTATIDPVAWPDGISERMQTLASIRQAILQRHGKGTHYAIVCDGKAVDSGQVS